MGLLDKIKEESKKSGQSKGKFIYFKEGEKKRIRFLQDMDEGMEVVFHDSYEQGINVPCQEIFGKDCPYCENESLRTRSLFVWSVYDYEANEVKVLMQAVNNCTAIPALMALYENYGTLTDRDFIITKQGKAQNTTFSVVPMDKNKFRNTKVKALSEEKLLKCINEAYPCEDSEDDEEEEYSPKKYKKNKADTKKKKPEPEEVEEDDDWDDEESEYNYSEMSAKELYQLCNERDIECRPKKPQKYYINLLEEYDNAQDDWSDDEDEEDDWEE